LLNEEFGNSSFCSSDVLALLSNIQTLDGHVKSFCARQAKRFSKSFASSHSNVNKTFHSKDDEKPEEGALKMRPFPGSSGSGVIRAAVG
jgi:hypothetical protein